MNRILQKNGFSIVIPCRNESENIPHLAGEIDSIFESVDFPWEVIWVNDASIDNSKEVATTLRSNHRMISNVIRRGQSTSIQIGIEESKFPIIGLIDGDGQNHPRDLLIMFVAITENPSIDFLQGRRMSREDGFLKRRLPSLVANHFIKFFVGSPFKDLGCGTKVFRKFVANEIPFSGEIHRLYAAHAHLTGFNVVEMDVVHRRRLFGKSSYGYERIFKFILDIILLRLRHLAVRNSYYFLGFSSLLIIMFGLGMWVIAALLRFLDIKDHFDGSLTIGGLLCILLGFSILMITTSIEVFATKVRPVNPNASQT